ncbi:MAG: glycosyltransferase [Candidatus Moranbacteria bacterium]|nr:glycosyltransferase [Candidatus Moranbacteria bacterium]
MKSNNEIRFSIVIPVQKINDYIWETCGKLKELKSKNFEVIIFPDEIEENNAEIEKKLGARIIPSGKVSPAIKRDMAMKYAEGEYLAFTDDDAYPDEKWLDTAEKYLEDEGVSAVGGPQLTPEDDSFWQKVSGAMFMSILSGGAIIRYWPGKKTQEVDDWPTVNFIMKKKDFEEIGGFDSAYWPGEDTKLCLDIIKKLQKKILYVPEMVVFHHRRSGFKKHLKQTGNYGLHRGHFARIFPETSLKLASLYFVPSLFVAFLLLGLIGSFFSMMILKMYLLGLGIYATAILISTILLVPKTKSVMISIATIPYLISFHVWYGIRFVKGFFFTKELRSKLGK